MEREAAGEGEVDGQEVAEGARGVALLMPDGLPRHCEALAVPAPAVGLPHGDGEAEADTDSAREGAAERESLGLGEADGEGGGERLVAGEAEASALAEREAWEALPLGLSCALVLAEGLGEGVANVVPVALNGLRVAPAEPLAAGVAGAVALSEPLLLRVAESEARLLRDGSALGESLPLLRPDVLGLGEGAGLSVGKPEGEGAADGSLLWVGGTLALGGLLGDGEGGDEGEAAADGEPLSQNVAVRGAERVAEGGAEALAAPLRSALALSLGVGEGVSPRPPDAVAAAALGLRCALAEAMLPVAVREAERVSRALREADREADALLLSLPKDDGEGAEVTREELVTEPRDETDAEGGPESVGDSVLRGEGVAPVL